MPYSERTQLLSTTTIANSSWWNVEAFDSITLHVSGVSASEDTVQFYGSNDYDTPANENQIGSDLTASDLVTIDPGFRWLRVKRSAVSTGSRITVQGLGKVTWSR